LEGSNRVPSTENYHIQSGHAAKKEKKSNLKKSSFFQLRQAGKYEKKRGKDGTTNTKQHRNYLKQVAG